MVGCDQFVMDSCKIRQGKSSVDRWHGNPPEKFSDSAMEEFEDLIEDGDILSIIVYHPSRTDLMQTINFISSSVGFEVKRGMVDIPDLPPIAIKGLSLEQARERLQETYRKQVQDIELFVSYQDRKRQRIELAGLVSTPTLSVDGQLRLYEALAVAAVPTEANLFQSYILRDGKRLGVDFYRLLREGDMSQNIVLKGGDKIYVASPSDGQVVVMGEVWRPKTVDVPNGFITLREALAKAGGIPYTGNKNHIQVIRGSLQKPKVYRLAWNAIARVPNDCLLLIPGDTVYVEEKLITKWNRFVSQLLPTFSGISTGYGVSNSFGY